MDGYSLQGATSDGAGIGSGTAGGAHLWGSVTGGNVTQIARDWIAIKEINVSLGGGPDRSRSEQPALMASHQELWNIPPRVRSFVGREPQIKAIREHLLDRSRSVLLPEALHGLGGIGKTQLALAYAHQYRDEYALGWWVPAETESSTLASLARLAVLLGGNAGLDPRDSAANLSAELAARETWLLIFDNAASVRDVAPLLPAGIGGHILITSRSHAWAGVAHPVEVGSLPLAKAARLLRLRSGDHDVAASKKLAEELGGLPLALDQAAGYVNECGIRLRDYRDQFAAYPAELLRRGNPQSYPNTIGRTLGVALGRLSESSPAAVQLLRLCSLMAPEDLPVDLIFDAAAALPGPLAAVAANRLDRNDCMATLLSSGMLSTPSENRYWIHRLVQTVTRENLDARSYTEALAHAAVVLRSGMSEVAGPAGRHPAPGRYVEHAKAVVRRCRDADVITDDVVTLTLVAGEYLLRHRYDTDSVEALFRWLVSSTLRWAEEGDLRVARAMSGLGRALQAQGNHQAGLEFAERALRARRRLHPGDHPDVAASLSDVATSMYWLGADDEARGLHQEALDMRRRLFAGDHRDVAASLTMLGASYYGLLDYARARELVEEGLAMRRRLGLRKDPEIAESLCDLAANLLWLGEAEAAKEAAAEAFDIDNHLFKSDHPDVLWCLKTLAESTFQVGEPENAKKMYELAVGMAKRLYEGDHLDLAWCLAGLASALCALGEIATGARLYEESAEMGERLYGADHLVRAYCFAGLAGTRAWQGELRGAAELKQRAVEMLGRLSPSFPGSVAARLDALADLAR